MQKEIDRQLRGLWTPRRLLAWAMMIFAAAMALNHLLMHMGFSWLPLSQGWQDLLVGWPMAGVIAIVGAIVLGAEPTAKPGRK